MRQEKLHEEYTATHDFFNPIIITQLHHRMQFLCVYICWSFGCTTLDLARNITAINVLLSLGLL